MFSTDVATREQLPPLSIEAAMNITKNTIEFIENGMAGTALAKMRVEMIDKPLVDRWREMITILLRTQAHCIIPFGYPPSEQGLVAFNNGYAQLLANHPRKEELKSLEKVKWQLLLQKVFSTKPGRPLSLDEARGLTAMVAARVQTPGFLKRLDKLKEIDAQKAQDDATELIMQEQMSIMRDYDYEGDGGYVQMHYALMEHMGDQQVTFNLVSTTTNVFRYLGMTL